MKHSVQINLANKDGEEKDLGGITMRLSSRIANRLFGREIYKAIRLTPWKKATGINLQEVAYGN